MNAVRLSCRHIRDGVGTCAFPYLYDGRVFRKLQNKVQSGTWLCGSRIVPLPPNDASFDKIWCLLEAFEKLTWITSIEWVTPTLCIFWDNSGSFRSPLETACKQLQWFLYRPYDTWKPICQNQ